MAYARKTCFKCGMSKPSNYMEQRVMKTGTGQSQNVLTFGTWFGLWFGITVSKNRIKRRFFANSRRGYKRKAPRWICYDNECNVTIHGERIGNEIRISGEGFLDEIYDDIRGFFWQSFLVVTSFTIAMSIWVVGVVAFAFFFWGGSV